MKIKKIIVSVVFFVSIFSVAKTIYAQVSNVPLDEKDLISISEPAIVKIYHQISGNLNVPTIRLDIATMSLSVDDKSSASSQNTYLAFPDHVISYKFDQVVKPKTIYGTGFVVNPDGYIVTNAHVASDNVSEGDYLRDVEKNLVDDMISAYEKKYPKKLDKIYTSQEQWDEIYTKLDSEMLKLITNSANFDSKLVVILQSSTDTTIDDLLKDGIEAKVVGMADDLFNEKNRDKDLAILKIDQSDLPVLKIDDTNLTQVGQKVFVWGFPSNATFDEKDVVRPSFTHGIINAFKDSSDKSFQLLQTDAKVSEGSSGGPIVNENGKVVGILTYVSGESSTLGDTFGWGLPSDFILQIMKKNSIMPISDYYDSFSKGIKLMNDKKCKSANDQFNIVKNTNQKFSVDKYVQPYIDECITMINSGQSVDSFLDQTKMALRDIGYKAWILIIISIIIIGSLVYEVFILLRRTKKDEAEIVKIEKLLSKDEISIPRSQVYVKEEDTKSVI